MRDMLSDDPLKRAAAFGKIASLLLVEENIDFLLEKDGLRFLIKAMKAALKGGLDANAKKIVSAGARALGRMSTDDTRIYKIMQEGGVKLLIAVMTSCPDDEDLSCSAMAALARMSTRKENAQFFADSGAIEATLAVLKAQPASTRVATNFIRFMSAMGMHKKVLKKMIGDGVLTALSSMISQHMNDPEISLEVLRCLKQWATKVDNADAMADAGIVGQIKLLLEKHAENPALVSMCLELIKQLCEISPKVHELLASNGTIDIVKMVMDKNSESESIVNLCKETLEILVGANSATRAVDDLLSLSKDLLQNLVENSAAYDSAQASKLLESVNAVCAILDEALANDDDAALQKLLVSGVDQALIQSLLAAAALCASAGAAGSPEAIAAVSRAIETLKKLIALDPSGTAAVAAANGMVELYRSSAQAPENQGLAESVADFGLFMATSAESSKVIMQQTGCVPALIEMMRAHLERPTVVSPLLRTLEVLVDSVKVAAEVIEASCVATLLECLLSQIEDVPAIVATLRVLQQCSTDFTTTKGVIDAGVLDALAPVIEKHVKTQAVMQEAVTLLSKLSKFQDLAQALAERDLLKPLVKSLRANYQSESLVENMLVLLEKISHDKATKKLLANKKLQTAELVAWLMEAYPENPKITKYGNLLTKTLSAPTEEEIAAALEKSARDQEKARLDKQKAEKSKLDVDVLDDDRIDLLFEQLDSLARDPLKDLLTNLLEALQDPEAAALLLQRGGMEKLLAVMEKYPEDNEILALAGQCYMQLVNQAGTDFDSADSVWAFSNVINNQEQVAADTLLSAVQRLAEMELTPELIEQLLRGAPWEQLMHILLTSKDPMLLAAAARLLAKLSNNETALACLSKLADLRELIATMRRNMENLQFLKYAVYLLSNLAVNEELKDSIGVEGGIQVILDVVEKYMEDEGLVDNATYAMSSLSTDNEVNCSFIMACSGIGIICRALESHPTAAALLEQCCSTLCNLCTSNDTNKDAVVEADAPKVISDVMMGNSDQLEMLSTCMRCLGHLCNDTKNVTAVVKSGSIQAIVSSLTSCSGADEEVLELKLVGIRVLLNMAAFNIESVMPTFNQEGAVELLCRMVEEHIEVCLQ